MHTTVRAVTRVLIGSLDPNDNNKNDTLHGGSNGWDYRNWTVEAHTTDSIVRLHVKAYVIDSEG